MFTKTAVFLAIAILAISCTMRMPADFIASPSGRYKLKVDLNRDKSDDKKYNCVLLTLCDSSYKEISALQTSASNTMKWAIGWYPSLDTVILNSKDIGMFAYRVSGDGKLVNIPVDNIIENEGNKIFKKKYADTK